MKSNCERLKNNIIKAWGNKKPYNTAFQPKDLGLNSDNYGSFSDHCKKGTTKSSKWCGCGLLRCVQKKPFKYILIK